MAKIGSYKVAISPDLSGFDNISDTITRQLSSAGTKAAKGMSNAINSSINNIKVPDVGNKISDSIGNGLKKSDSVSKGVGARIRNSIQSQLNKIELPSKIASGAKNIGERAGAAIKNSISSHLSSLNSKDGGSKFGFVDGIKSSLSGMASTTGKVFSGIGTGISATFRGISTIVHGIGGGISAVGNGAVSLIRGFRTVGSVISGAFSPIGAAVGVVTTLIGKIAGGLFNALKSVAKVIGSIIASVFRLAYAAFGALIKAATAAGAAMVSAFVKVVSEIGEAEQQVGGITQVYKDQAQVMLDWSRTQSLSMQSSTKEIRQWATQMGAQLTGGGLSVKQAGDTVRDVLTRTADVASVMNVPLTEAFEAVSAMMRNEYDSIDRLGVVINDTSLYNFALTHGFQGLTTAAWQALPPIQKTQLAIQQFMESTSYAAGNAARETSGLQGSLLTVKAAWQNVLYSFGNSDDLNFAMNQFTTSFITATKNVVAQIPIFVNGLRIIWPYLQTLFSELKAQVWDPIIAPELVAAWGRIVAWFTEHGPGIWEQITGWWNTNIAPNIIPALNAIWAFIDGTLIPWWKDTVWPAISKWWNNTAWPYLKNGIDTVVVPAIADAITMASDAAKEKMSNAGLNMLKGILQGMLRTNGVSWRLGVLKKFIVDAIRDKFKIHSPSKVMRDEVGVYLGLGILQGLESTIPAISSVSNRISTGITNSISSNRPTIGIDAYTTYSGAVSTYGSMKSSGYSSPNITVVNQVAKPESQLDVYMNTKMAATAAIAMAR